MRWPKRLLLAFAAVVLLLLALVAFERIRGRQMLERTRSQILGSALTAAPNAKAKAGQSNDAGADMQKSMEEIPGRNRLFQEHAPFFRMVPSGHQVVMTREGDWSADKGTNNNWESIKVEFAANRAALVHIRDLLDAAASVGGATVALPGNTNFVQLLLAKGTATWMATAAQAALHDGELPQATEWLVAVAQTPKLLESDRTAISQLVRNVLRVIARSVTWDALQSDGWTDGQLQRIGNAWDISPAKPLAELGDTLRGECAFITEEYRKARESNDTAKQAIASAGLYGSTTGSGDESWWQSVPLGPEAAEFIHDRIYAPLWRISWSYQAEQHDLEQMERLIALGDAAVAGKPWVDLSSQIDQLGAERDQWGWFQQLRSPMPDPAASVSQVIERTMRSETDRSLVLCAIALKRHFLRHGRYPESLNELVPEFLAAVPVDYMDGQPVKYHPRPDGTYILYSVGADGVDGGGDAKSPKGSEHSQDLWGRADYVWPAPATAEEVAAWRTSERKR